MAKALVGHLVASDPRRSRETLLLKQRVADLEAEVARLKTQNDELLAANQRDVDQLVPGDISDLEPVLR